ncbi:hypothetical protein V1J52_03065 [Streptomyces sp. TRM 70351]|uniref:hypothetical protein n=1 Tax=Streptomyces sp. TRM 70351 TaxID=3116552 RepID=UPI002E7C2CC4|nr:hypothetical protein [Streptomyces sp. TRM 70351]MEE1927171.1 hypothetical protein [Streptomyces sp. TRM 70351]
MICPHCDTSLLHRERTNRRCGRCARRFALEPKENGLRLHDNRAHRLVERLGDGGRVRYTPAQFWYAAGRGRLPAPGEGFVGCAVVLVVVLCGAVAGARAVFDLHGTRIAPVIGSALALFLLLLLLRWRSSRRASRLAAIRMPMELTALETELAEHWVAAYGAPPPGMVTGELPAGAWRGAGPPVAAVLCPDPSVLTCLAANGLPQRLAVRLHTAPEQIPDGLPTVVLHDASPSGVLFAAEARRVLGPRAVVAGLAPRTVLPAPGPPDQAGGPAAWRGPAPEEDTGPGRGLRLREAPPAAEEIARLREAERRLTEAEVAWLAAGWWFPLAAVRPAVLLEVVEAGVRRARERVDPDRHAARAVGFLTRPAGGGAAGPPDGPGPSADRPGQERR